VYQHLEQGLVTNALACGELTRLRYVGFGQSQRYLNAGSSVQLADKALSFWSLAFFRVPADFCFNRTRDPGDWPTNRPLLLHSRTSACQSVFVS